MKELYGPLIFLVLAAVGITALSHKHYTTEECIKEVENRVIGTAHIDDINRAYLQIGAMVVCKAANNDPDKALKIDKDKALEDFLKDSK